jgi:molybdenum cofactor biosynthesis protein B
VLSVSDTHTPATDTSGDILAERITAAGHVLAARAIVSDDAALITAQCEAWIEDPAIDPIVSTGGTRLTGRNVTPKALAMLPGARAIPGFGE